MNELLTYSNFLKTTDNEHIFYSTNFYPNENEIHEDVIIFNYGLVCSNLHWKYQIPYFINNGYKVLVHDYRGHYLSTSSNVETITFENITNDLFQICQNLNIKNSLVFGHSMGVNVSLEFARKFPAFVKKLILISGTVIFVDNVMFDTNAMDHVRPILSSLNKNYLNVFQTFWKYSGWSPIVRHLIKQGGFNVDLVSDEFIQIYLNKIGELGPEVFFHLLGQMQHHDILAHLPKIKTKTLVMGGDNDKVIPNHLQKLLFQQLQNSEIYILRKGSHVPQVDFPEFINERAHYFLKS